MRFITSCDGWVADHDGTMSTRERRVIRNRGLSTEIEPCMLTTWTSVGPI